MELRLIFLICITKSLRSLGFNAAIERRDRHSTRYFSEELILPPLPLSRDSLLDSSSSSLPYGISHGRSIPAVYTNSPQSISKWLSDNVPTSGCTIGFDVESNPSTPWTIHPRFEGPCTVQFATANSCLVVHLFRKSGRPSVAAEPILEAVLSDDTIIKAGVGIDKDLIELCKAWGPLDARSRLNLGGIGAGRRGKETTGLKRLSKAILHVDLQKSRKLAAGNWNQLPLSDKQIAYCARDAWAGAAIVEELRMRDPDTFSPVQLRSLLENQQPIVELTTDALERKSARVELASLMAPFQKRRSRKFPTHLQRKLSDLQGTIRALKPSPPLAFDVSSLGICIEPNNLF